MVALGLKPGDLNKAKTTVKDLRATLVASLAAVRRNFVKQLSLLLRRTRWGCLWRL